MTANQFDFTSIELALPKGVFAVFMSVNRDVIAQKIIAPADSIPHELSQAVPKRKNEFYLGRIVANEALEETGCELPLSNKHFAGAPPVWPKGFTGSITHTSGLIGAAVCSTENYSAIGLDAEALMSEKTAARVIQKIVSEKEHEHLLQFAKQSNRSVEDTLTLFFSAKEAIYKANSALYPERNRFHDVEVVFGSNTFEYYWQNERSTSGIGHFLFNRDHVITLVAKL